MMTMLLLAVMGSAWAEDAYYTLTPAKGTNNSYTGNCDITIDGITWNLTGNSQLLPWRIGGKSITSADRTVYSKTEMESAIDKVELTVGAASSITVNSLKLTVASDASFSTTTIIDEVSASFEANSTITFEPNTDNKWSTGSYYKFTFNVTVSSTSNKFVEFKEAKFYASNDVSPIINANNVSLTYDATSGEIPYTITNPVEGGSLSASSTDDWIRNIAVAADKVTFTTTQNEGNVDRTGTITLSYGGATKEITVTQRHLVIDYATLPFTYDGNGTELPTGLTQNGLGTYGSSPAMKFDTTDDYLILKFNEAPGILTFDIKGNSFSGGTFKVQTSIDGDTYTDLETYNSLDNIIQSEEFNLAADVRYIKWVYTEKVSGNVALGNIRLDKVLLLSYPQASYTANLYDGFEAPLLSNPYNLSPITYSSSNESVAKVKVDGSVVLFGVGTTEITASFAGNDEHEAGTASYTLTVSKHSGSTIYIKVTSTSDLVVGKKYIFVEESQNAGMGDYVDATNPYWNGITNLVIENGIVDIADKGLTEFVLGGESINGYTFENNSYSLQWNSAGSNELKLTQDAGATGITWELRKTNDGFIAVNKILDNEAERVIRYNFNGTANRFAAYKGTSNTLKDAVLYVQESGVEYEEVIFATAGYKTYVTENAIDWTATEAKGVEGIQVTDLSKTSVALQKLGEGLITVANTPVILKGKEGVNLLVIANDEGSDISSTNLLKRGSERKESEKNFMYVLQKSNNWSEENPYDEYNFYPLRPSRWNDIGDRQAYLVLATAPGGSDIGGETGGPGLGVKPIPIIFINANDEEPMVSDDAGLVDGINDIQRNEALDGEFYSISGVRVAAPTKGLYIVNGKKVLVK